MFIYDNEIRERFGAAADQIIADLDADHKTQKNLATYPAEARYRPSVDDYLKLRAARDAQHSANMGEFGKVTKC